MMIEYARYMKYMQCVHYAKEGCYNPVVDHPEYLTSLDVARRLNVDHESVKRWLRTGQLIGYQFGRQWRVRPDDLERFIEERRNVDNRPKDDPETGKWGIITLPQYGEELSG